MKYKLIKTYPGSPELDTICKYDKNPWSDSNSFLNPVLNLKDYPEFWQPVVEKDYEILSYITIKSEIIKYKDLDINDDCNCDRYLKIHSVKRLSDSEIFTIGDTIDIRIDNKYKQEILEINIVKNEIRFKTKKGVVVFYIAVKLKQPLFTTEDGVDIFESDKYYSIGIKNVNNLFKIAGPYINPQATNPTGDILHFSTKEKAEEYILLNKPCLSLNDVQKIITSRQYTGFTKKLLEEITTLVNSKLK